MTDLELAAIILTIAVVVGLVLTIYADRKAYKLRQRYHDKSLPLEFL